MEKLRSDLKSMFQLDPEVVFFNHGSFGACPREVMKVYQDWQCRFERQPVQFMRELGGYYKQAHEALAGYLHVGPDDLGYVVNATHGVNVVTHSLKLSPGDQVLTTNHEYGACNSAWIYACERSGAEYVQQTIPLPVRSPEEVVECFWQGVTPRTRVIFLSHITSPTAMCLPIEEICRRARQAGILTLIDGAHAPGQIPLNLETLGADFYVGNCHKWMMSPKGVGFLYVRPEHQKMIEPLVVGHSYQPGRSISEKPKFAAYLESVGTRDPAAVLSISAAIEFMKVHRWDEVRQDCKNLLSSALERISEVTDLPPAYPLDSDFYSQMAIAPLHPDFDPAIVHKLALEPYRIEIPVIRWEKLLFLRISVQGYTTEEDVDSLLNGVKHLYQELVPARVGV